MTRAHALRLVVLAALALSAAFVFLGPHAARTPLPNQAYIWQRSWTPGVSAAMRASARVVESWHVLAAQYERAGSDSARWRDAAPDWRALAVSAKPVVAVFRIDGDVTRWDDAALSANIAARLANWRAHGVSAAGVEIDYDCGTARLADYARFLRALRPALAAFSSPSQSLPLSVTALPTWLGSTDLETVLDASDASVLQLHAVMNPVQGLFDADKARGWIAAYAGRTRKPWRIALPAYGTRVTWDASGRIVAVESERPALYPGGIARELVAPPERVRDFVARLDRRRPRGLDGIVWFRLPTDADVRAWSLASWQAVLGREPLVARVSASGTLAMQSRQAEQAASAGNTELFDVRLSSTGNADAALPRAVRIDASCTAADGIDGYALDYDARGMLLRRAQSGLLRAGDRISIGWMRCAASAHEITLDAEP